MSDVAAIVLAAGSGTRLGAGINKVLLPLHGRPMLARTLDAFESHPAVDRVVLVGAERELPRLNREVVAAFGLRKPTALVAGGQTRHESERNGLEALAVEIGAGAVRIVLVHDAARPLVSPGEIDRVIAAAREGGAAILALPMDDPELVALAGDDSPEPPPAGLWGALTPQAFDARLILDAHRQAAAAGFAATDTASVAERSGCRVTVVAGSRANIKITTAEDLALAELLLRGQVAGRGGDPHL